MKRLALPLIAATPFLSALAPHADAAAITSHRPSMNPLRLGTAPAKRHFNHGLGAAPMKPSHPPRTTAATTLDSVLDGLVSNAAGSTIDLGSVKTGSGTLTFDGSNTYSGEIIVTSGAAIQLSGGTLSGNGTVISSETINTSGGTVETNNWILPTGSNGTVLVTGGQTSTEAWTIGNGATPTGGSINLSGGMIQNGWLTLGGNTGSAGVTNPSVAQTSSNLTIADGGVVSIANGDTSPAVPVPEPGTAMLFVLGMLAVSQVRRRAV